LLVALLFVAFGLPLCRARLVGEHLLVFAELAVASTDPFALGEQGGLAERQRRCTGSQLRISFRELELRHAELLSLGHCVGAQPLELIVFLRCRLARVSCLLHFGLDPSTLRFERAFALLELARAPCEDGVELAELRLACSECGGPGLEIGLAPREELVGIRTIGVDVGSSVAAEAQAVSAVAPELRPAAGEIRPPA